MSLYSLRELQEAIATQPEAWRPLVFTNGCFDIIHAGHVRYLQTAKELGKAMIVGVNSDESVKKIKKTTWGMPERPIIPESERAEVVGAIKGVAGVVIFGETTATKIIEALQPEVYVKGGDYSISNLPEAQAVQAYGGKIELINIEVPNSTTAIIKRILKAGGS